MFKKFRRFREIGWLFIQNRRDFAILRQHNEQSSALEKKAAK
jgi:hypothetical protein